MDTLHTACQEKLCDEKNQYVSEKASEFCVFWKCRSVGADRVILNQCKPSQASNQTVFASRIRMSGDFDAQVKTTL